MKRATLQKIVAFLLRNFTELEFIGEEYIPAEGPLIVATNHLSRLDIPILFMIPKRGEITALVADKYKKYPILNWFTETAEGIWIDRTKADFSAFKAAFDVLKKGGVLGISPEGTRSETGALQEGKYGTAMIASKSATPIIPVAIAGSENAFAKIFTFRKPHIVVRIGPAFTLPSLSRENREEQLKQSTDEIMCRIAALLPENYRGYYAGCSRLNELLTA